MEVLKIGGNEIAERGFLDQLAQAVSKMDEPAVIVHGGGRAISDLQSRLGLEVMKVDGLRVTDAESMNLTQMILSGHTNKAIVVALLAAGVDAVGISGVDGGLLRCVKKQHPSADLGFVGEIVEVRSTFVKNLIGLGITPVISPVSLGVDGKVYNVNADEAAGALSASLQARILNFISNVPGVLDEMNRPIPSLTAIQTERLIEEGVIRDGMVPKVRAALDVIGRGVPCARIVNMNGFANNSGTMFCS